MKRDERESVPMEEEIAAVACAVQNMHLTATAFGLGAYWGTGGMTYHPKMREYLGFTEKDRVMGLFYVGYPNIEWPRKSIRKQVREITEWREG
jgi:nitroreductase